MPAGTGLREGRSGLAGAAAAVITGWALLGGVALLAVVVMNVVSVVGAIFGHPFPGDFEMTEIGVAVAAFAFLPYCQMTDANVTADIFTQNASPRWIAIFKLAASVVALLFALLLLWRMSVGMSDQREYGYETAILQFPIWVAFIPILISLALLAVASVLTLAETGARAAGGGRE
ncbi:TRAP transporter small permease [Tranquillimonas rosea]|uniref:TRAP transporter small permease n=1 Tax=Tranquillimonas rosea TaxID=641238 RepID=UPI003BAC63FF